MLESIRKSSNIFNDITKISKYSMGSSVQSDDKSIIENTSDINNNDDSACPSKDIEEVNEYFNSYDTIEIKNDYHSTHNLKDLKEISVDQISIDTTSTENFSRSSNKFQVNADPNITKSDINSNQTRKEHPESNYNFEQELNKNDFLDAVYGMTQDCLQKKKKLFGQPSLYKKITDSNENEEDSNKRTEFINYLDFLLLSFLENLHEDYYKECFKSFCVRYCLRKFFNKSDDDINEIMEKSYHDFFSEKEFKIYENEAKKRLIDLIDEHFIPINFDDFDEQKIFDFFTNSIILVSYNTIFATNDNLRANLLLRYDDNDEKYGFYDLFTYFQIENSLIDNLRPIISEWLNEKYNPS